MLDVKTIFDGIGTALVTFALGILFGGTAGYRIAIRKTTNIQKQKAGDNSSQTQVGKINYGD